MKAAILMLMLLVVAAPAPARGDDSFRHIGDFLIESRLKVIGGRVTPVAIKPLRLSAYTDGLSVRISTEGDSGQASEYEIYRSDGIGRQPSPGGALEVVPGVQAVAEHSGVFRQLRLTRDTLTITTFPGVSDQIVVTHAVLAPDGQPAPPRAIPVSEASLR